MGAKRHKIMIVFRISEIEKQWGRWHGFRDANDFGFM